MSYSPYEPPRHDHGYGHGYGSTYVPLGWKTNASAIGIIGMVILQPIQSALSLAFGEVLKNPSPDNLGVILLNGLVSLLQLAVMVATYVFFLMWMHQAAKNVRAFNQPALTITPGWAVGWWFIPFASLWMPFAAMREIFKASDPKSVGPSAQHSWMMSPSPPTLGLWWGAYLLNSFLGAAAVLVSMDFSKPAPVMHGPGALTWVAHAMLAVAGISIVGILRTIAKRQEEAWAIVSSSPPSTNVDPPAQGASAVAPMNPYVPAGSSDNPYLNPRS